MPLLFWTLSRRWASWVGALVRCVCILCWHAVWFNPSQTWNNLVNMHLLNLIMLLRMIIILFSHHLSSRLGNRCIKVKVYTWESSMVKSKRTTGKYQTFRVFQPTPGNVQPNPKSWRSRWFRWVDNLKKIFGGKIWGSEFPWVFFFCGTYLIATSKLRKHQSDSLLFGGS